MPKARRKKKTSFEASPTKSVFLYGDPNKDKLASLKQMQALFAALVNKDIELLASREDIALQLVKNDKKDSFMRSLEKSMREPGVNSAFCQNAFDVAVTHLSNRLGNIRTDLISDDSDIFAISKVLFAKMIMHCSKEDMASAMLALPEEFHKECAEKIAGMSDAEFDFAQKEFFDKYSAKCLEYRIPHLKTVSVPLDSRLMKLEPSTDTVMPYVISITNPIEKGKRIIVPIGTSKHSLHKIQSNHMAGTVVMQVRKGKLRIGWSYTRHMNKPCASRYEGVDVGITDALHTSDNQAIGSMAGAIQFYHDAVEPAFAEISSLRNKKRAISHYLRAHTLPEDVRRSLIRKMDILDTMIQTMDAPYRKKRRYYEFLDKEISTSVDQYIKSIDHNTVTVLEKLDIKEFEKSRKQNGKFSTFARGKLQKRLMSELNWRGFDFVDVEPDYTSRVCPECSNLDHDNRNGKDFTCTYCGYHADADYVGALNIKARATDQDVLDACEKHKYSHTKMQNAIKIIYYGRHAAIRNSKAESA